MILTNDAQLLKKKTLCSSLETWYYDKYSCQNINTTANRIDLKVELPSQETVLDESTMSQLYSCTGKRTPDIVNLPLKNRKKWQLDKVHIS